MPNYGDIKYPAAAAATTIVSDMAGLVALSGMSSGDQALVTSLNKLFMYTGSGWFLIATMTNASPTSITGVDGTYALASDGTATTITAVSTDPEGFPLTWSYSTSGLGAIATVSNVNNVFTITPSTDSANFGTFTLTISVTDGATGAVNSVSSLSLSFAITNSRYTSLLVATKDAGNNSNITDNSSESPANNTAHSLTIAGNTSAGSFSPYRQGGYSVEFVSNAYLSFSALTDFDMGTNPWTVNFWFYADTQSNNFPSIFSSVNYNVVGSSSIRWDNHTRANKIFMYTNGVGDPAIVTTNTLSLNQWHYVTVTRENATDLKIYVNGTADASLTISSSQTFNFNSSGTRIGRGFSVDGAAGNFIGSLRDLRVIKGSGAVQTSVPTEPLTAVTNTKLLACALPYIADANTQVARKTLAVTGGIETSATGPYNILDEADVANGNSIYFDGSGDYIAVANSADMTLNTDWCIECWYWNESNAVSGIWYQYGSSAENQVHYFNTRNAPSTGGLELGTSNSTGNTSVQGLGTLPNSQMNLLRTWTHVSLTKEGTTLRYFFNGILQNTVTKSGNAKIPTDPFVIGAITSWGDSPMKGYIADFRLVKGSAVRTASFTLPTSPLALHSDTKISVTGKNASVFDKAQAGNLKLIGNTTGHYTTKFSGAFSTYFDGNDRLDPSDPSQAFPQPTEDWSIEFWCKNIEVVSGSACFVGWGAGSGSGVTNQTFMIDYTGTKIRNTWQSNDISSTSDYNLNDGTWRHVAFTFDNSTGVRRIFVGGVLDGSSTSNAGAYTNTSNGQIGRSPVYTARYLKGYLQDFRVTRGLCRHVNNGGTYSYPLPTAPLKG